MKDKPDMPNAIMTLYDVWVYNNLKTEREIIAYVPLDHVTMPPMVEKFLRRDQVTPVTMSEHGQRMLEARGIKSTYAPHSVDTKVFLPTHDIMGEPTRQFMGLTDDHFLVSIVAANKANGLVHRKALAEQILAFSIFKRSHEDAKLYLHMEPTPVFGGFNIPALLAACGLTKEDVIVADSTTLRVGYTQEQLAALYTTADVVLNATMGEGFGVASIEAQACGTRIVTSNWTASQDLAGPDSFLIDGQPFWDEPQAAWWNVPLVDSLVNALELAYQSPRGVSLEAVKFAKQFDVEKVWSKYWMPFLKDYFG
jgi:glycosyltransferase involved in cell wall biosynthesis